MCVCVWMLVREHCKHEHKRFVSTDFFFGPTHVRLSPPNPKYVFFFSLVCVRVCAEQSVDKGLGVWRGCWGGDDGWWVGDWRTGWWVGVCVGRLGGWLFMDVNLGVQRWGYWSVCVCVCVCAVICISVCMCLRTCIYSSASERVRVCVLPVRRLACVCVCSFVLLWVAGWWDQLGGLKPFTSLLLPWRQPAGREGARGPRE